MTEIARAEGPEVLEELRDRWQRLIEIGHLEEAEVILEQALEWALQQNDERQIDSVVCVLAAVAINLGRGEAGLPKLRQLLWRSSTPATCPRAAYSLSVYYQFARNYKKSVFYARIACDYARQLN